MRSGRVRRHRDSARVLAVGGDDDRDFTTAVTAIIACFRSQAPDLGSV
jgi:hypothetical protein